MQPIKFYSVADEYGEFSNFALYPIRLDGKTWQTTEHYFQAQKFKDPKAKEKVRKAKTPMLAATLGRDRRQKLRRDWESIKVQVMKRALEAKFTQHNEIREVLVGTHPAVLIEHTSNDSYWGDGGNGKGQNMLGRLLMQVRASLLD